MIEIDGGYHNRQERHDELRSSAINHLGIDVIRFKNEEIIHNTEELLDKLEAYLQLKHNT